VAATVEGAEYRLDADHPGDRRERDGGSRLAPVVLDGRAGVPQGG